MSKKDKIAFVTGAAGGLGKEVVEKLLAKQFIVFANDKNEKELDKLVLACESTKLYPLCFDVTEEQAWQKAAEIVASKFEKIDVLFNNAGIFKIESFLTTSVELWDQTMVVNARSAFLGIKTMLPLLRAGSSIINTSSIASFLGSKNRVAYAASKGAVAALTKAAAIELASEGIRVNSVHPAYMNTQMAEHAAEATNRTMTEMGERIPLYNRISTTEEVADVVIFLASSASRFMTGAELVVDGGQSVN